MKRRAFTTEPTEDQKTEALLLGMKAKHKRESIEARNCPVTPPIEDEVVSMPDVAKVAGIDKPVSVPGKCGVSLIRVVGGIYQPLNTVYYRRGRV
jgi:hypothetical protein